MTDGYRDDPRDLFLELTLDAPRALVWRCWTEPDLLTRWFTPAPWTTHDVDIDPCSGGRMNVVMRSPDGEEHRHAGLYLDVVPGERLVFTDAYAEGWLPAEHPFMTAIVTLADAGDGATAYTARVRHWTTEDRDKHVEMGFKDGWTAAARQLEELARSLQAVAQ